MFHLYKQGIYFAFTFKINNTNFTELHLLNWPLNSLKTHTEEIRNLVILIPSIKCYQVKWFVFRKIYYTYYI